MERENEMKIVQCVRLERRRCEVANENVNSLPRNFSNSKPRENSTFVMLTIRQAFEVELVLQTIHSSSLPNQFRQHIMIFHRFFQSLHHSISCGFMKIDFVCG